MTWLAPPLPDDASPARLEELASLAELGRAILGAQLDLHKLAELIYQRAGRIVDTAIFQLGLFDGDRYRMLIWVVDGVSHATREFRLTPESLGIVGWVRETGQPLLVRDYETEMESLPAQPRYLLDNPPRSAIFVPLQVGERVLGVMSIQSRTPAAFTDEDLRLLTIIGNTAAAAFENAQLYEQMQRRATQLQLLAEVSKRLNILQPLPAFYQQVVELVSGQFYDVFASLFEYEREMLRLVATTRPDWKGATLIVPLGTGPVGEAAQTMRPVILQQLPEYHLDAAEAFAATLHAEMALPLEVEGRVLGVLSVQSQRTVFDDTMVALFQSLAAQMAFAALEAQVYSTEQRRAEQLAAIAQASRVIVSTLELDQLLDEVLELAEDRFGFANAQIYLWQAGRLVFRAGTQAWEARWVGEPLAYALDGPGLIALAGRTLKPVLVDDVHAHGDYVAGPGLADTRTEMAVPLVMADSLLGVFDVQSDKVAAFTADDLQMLQTLTDTLAVAVRNARLFETERRRRQLAESLREVSAALTSTLNLDDVLALILSGLARVMTYDVASILLSESMDDGLVLRSVRARREYEVNEHLGAVLRVRLLPSEASAPATVAFGQVDEYGDYHDLLNLPEPHACLAALLTLQGQHLGYLVVDRVGVDNFAPEEVELITAFAAQASVAMENARLYTAQREQAWVSTALLQVAESIAGTPELQDALATVARITPMLVGVEWSAVFLAEGDVFHLHGFHRLNDNTLPESIDGIHLAEWPKLAEMAAMEEPVVLEPDEEAPQAVRAWLNGVSILLPLRVKGRVQGAMWVGQAAGEAPFTPHRIRLLGGIANQASLALESALLDDAQREEAWVNAALLQVAEALAAQPTLEESLETVTRLTPMLVGVERVAVYRWQRDTQRFVPGRCIGFTCEEGVLVATALELEIDTSAASVGAVLCRPPERLARAFGSELVRVWPLWARGELFGALVVEHGGELGRRLSILNGIAQQLAVAMENAALVHELAAQQRLERELELGRDIQASFLPESTPQAPGWEVAAFWQSARQVGGDFYDFIPLRSQDGVTRWGIAIADVSDKGVPAALFMALSRTLLRSSAIHRTSPGATLTRLNEMILSDVRTSQFVTVFYAIWEPGTGRFAFANGGHNPPLLVRADGTVETLKIKGAALAVFEAYYYHQAEIMLAPEEVVLLYTDGLPDAIDASRREFGMERMTETLRAAQAASASEIIAALEAAVRAHTGEVEPFDDLTMVVLKRTGN
ncbi:MAG: GAF domain-containing protein [Anaerolineales bacterium]